MTSAVQPARFSRELKLFVVASLALGLATSMMDSTMNNFLNDRFAMTGLQRSFLEFPRELPGLLVVFVSAALWFLCSRRLGALALGLGGVGSLLIGYFSVTYEVMVIWLFLYSMGQHIFLPISSTIGMELAREGQAGQRLGQLNAIRNVATIFGSFLVFLGFKYMGFTYQHTFTIAALVLMLGGVLLYAMKPEETRPARAFLTLHKEYRLYYVLSILYGSRKQLFITFAPWVLVNVLGEPVQILATLMTIGGVVGILFQPLLGWLIDHFGERVVLASEAVLLVFVCFGYGFARELFPESAAFYVICICYLVDQMLMSVSMARATYLKKTALEPAHIQSTLTAGVTIDHLFSIMAAILGGLLWNAFGYQYVFLMGAVIAAINFFVALRVKVPARA